MHHGPESPPGCAQETSSEPVLVIELGLSRENENFAQLDSFTGLDFADEIGGDGAECYVCV